MLVSPSASSLSVATVIPTSTSAGVSIHRPLVEVAGRPRRFLVDQIRSIDTAHIVGEPVDCLGWEQLAEVEFALVHYLGLSGVT